MRWIEQRKIMRTALEILAMLMLLVLIGVALGLELIDRLFIGRAWQCGR